MLAGFGLVVCAGLAVLLIRADLPVPGWACAGLAATAAVDLVIVQLRRRARRAADGDGHSLFE